MSTQDDANRLSNLSSDLPIETALLVQERLSEVISQGVDILGAGHEGTTQVNSIQATALQCIGEAIASMRQIGQIFTDVSVNMMRGGGS